MDVIHKVIGYALTVIPHIRRIKFGGTRYTTPKFVECMAKIVEKADPRWFSFSCCTRSSNQPEYFVHEDFEEDNVSEIRKKCVDFAFFSKEGKTLMIGNTEQLTITSDNNDWVQVENYIYIINFDHLDIDKVSF
mmetsp:Transcript_23540/g.27007  ORF Transcript_23540/g.27007 Transcript_23540/m.27007 type:complete len:134 (+) Transcript_23540:794-1195(+)